MEATTKAAISKRLNANPRYAFSRGFKGVHDDCKESAKNDLMQVFNIISEPAWFRRLYGRVTPNIEQMSQVEAVFKRYGVAKAKVWGV